MKHPPHQFNLLFEDTLNKWNSLMKYRKSGIYALPRAPRNNSSKFHRHNFNTLRIYWVTASKALPAGPGLNRINDNLIRNIFGLINNQCHLPRSGERGSNFYMQREIMSWLRIYCFAAIPEGRSLLKIGKDFKPSPKAVLNINNLCQKSNITFEFELKA